MADLLLVDNDRRIVDLVAFFLGKRGHVVRTAESFAAARLALAERAPDLVLSDIDLGAERGDEELPRLARAGVLPRTLVVSGYLDAALERELARLPQVVGLLRKPFDLARLEAAVSAALTAPLAPGLVPTPGEPARVGSTSNAPSSLGGNTAPLVATTGPVATHATGAAASSDPARTSAGPRGTPPSHANGPAPALGDDDDGWVDVGPFGGRA